MYQININTVIPDNENFNKGTEYGQSIIENSLRKFGAGRSILIDKNNRIIAGNKTIENAINIGMEDIIVIETSGDKIVAVKRNDIDLDSQIGRELALADNATSKANIEWNEEIILEVSDKYNIDISEWGLSDILIQENNLENEDDVPSFISCPIVKSGDIIELNNHRLLCGNTSNIDELNMLMNSKKADMIFTDPPYDLQDNYSKNIIEQAKKDCHVFIMNSDKLLISNINNNIDYFRKMMYVDFRVPRLVSNNQPMTRVDPIAEFLKGKGKFNNLYDGFSTLIECSKIHSNKVENSFGFNQTKRVELPETFILHYSNPNDLVCDFFGGSGSTLIACEKNNRLCYLNELDKSHCDIIIKRWILYMKELNKMFEIKINGNILNNEFINKIIN